MTGGRHRGFGLYAVVCALVVGCNGQDPAAPPLDGGGDLGGAETTASADAETSTDVVDVSVLTDRGADSGAVDATAPIDKGTFPDAVVADATAPTDRGVDVVGDTFTPSDGGVDAAATDAAAPSAEFAAIYETILRPRCATSGCHVEGSSTTRLALSDAASAYARLVNARDECSFNTGSRIRVVPFDPSMSAIMIFNQDGLCGRRHNALMPNSYGGDARSADLERFRAWIMVGAR